MKEFFKMAFATMTGMVMFTLLIVFISIICIMGMVASSEATRDAEDNSVLVLNLSGTLQERSEEIPMIEQLMGSSGNQIGLDEILGAIKKAKENEKIKGIYIESGIFASDSWASLQSIRNALSDFRKTGKWIVAYGDSYTQETYYLASVANKVYMNPQGMIEWRGLAAEPVFLKDLLAKFGVSMQLAKVGKYKSAPEMFTEDKMSEPNREQISVYINGVWKNICKDVSESRKISIDSLNAYADRLITFESQPNLVKNKMVDKLIYTDEVRGEVKKLMKLNEEDKLHQLSVADMINVKESKRDGGEIAVYYAYGDIVDEEGGSLFGSADHNINAKEVCKDLEELMNDDEVKAVVIRINSGGGSAYASEQIWRQVGLLNKKKPVVVSMGGYAASGGYYISCAAPWIVAEPTTLTGSIGIFGMFPDVSGLLKDKLGVKFDEVKTNKNSSFGTKARPFNPEEIAFLEKYIDRGYNLFRMRVAQGRKMSEKDVEAIAQGRVWSGEDALRIKLVDQLGGLDAAINKAAKLAKLSSHYSINYPAKKDFLDRLMNGSEGKNSYLDEQLRITLGEFYRPMMILKDMQKHDVIQARLPYELRVR